MDGHRREGAGGQDPNIIPKSPEPLEMVGCTENICVLWLHWGFLDTCVCKLGVLGSQRAWGVNAQL